MFLNASYGLLYDAPFDVVLDIVSPSPLFSPSIVSSNFVHVLTQPLISKSTSSMSSILTGPPTTEPPTSDQLDEVKLSSLVCFLL
jgi:hypothetical protein